MPARIVRIFPQFVFKPAKDQLISFDVDDEALVVHFANESYHFAHAPDQDDRRITSKGVKKIVTVEALHLQVYDKAIDEWTGDNVVDVVLDLSLIGAQSLVALTTLIEKMRAKNYKKLGSLSKMKQILLIAATIALATASTCQSPQHSATTFSTTDGFFHFQTTFIAEFSLQCANKLKDPAFYAVVNGNTYQVAHSDDTNKYQVSFSLEHEKAGSQTFNIGIYDEDGFAAYKNAERNGDVSSAKPLFTIPLSHPGLSRKSPISCEAVALAAAILALYFAFNLKSQATA
ncbi:unnamed protein product, partial [Mesorhabditis belari]|uniref:Translocon-associated protein subunit delta n=1 Tax=Mesorhabditis belari TaxID=2138241 RepID=A0AAF3FBN4_9BILA